METVCVYHHRQEKQSDHVLEEKPRRNISSIKHKLRLCVQGGAALPSHDVYSVYSIQQVQPAADLHHLIFSLTFLSSDHLSPRQLQSAAESESETQQHNEALWLPDVKLLIRAKE